MNLRKFSDVQTHEFLKLYQNCECLWNYTHPKYKDKREREHALEFISNQMGIIGFDKNEVLKKIRSIRNTFIQQRNKILNGAYCEPRLSWYKTAYSFLNDVVGGERECISNSEQNQRLSDSLMSDQITLEQDNSSRATSQENEKIITKSKKRKLEKQTFKEFSHVVKVLDEIKRTERYGDDEFDTFGNNIACQLRKLPLEKALKMQIRIQELLRQERIDYEMEKRKTQRTTNAFGFN